MRWASVGGALCVALAGCRSKKIEVVEAVIVAPAGDAPGVMYGFVHNGTDEPDTLLGVTTDAARRAELHQETLSAPDTAAISGTTHPAAGHDMANMGAMPGMAMMAPVARVAIGANTTLNLIPGKYHVMLLQPRALRRGEEVPVTLRFARSGDIHVTARVIGYADVDKVLFVTVDSTLHRKQ